MTIDDSTAASLAKSIEQIVSLLQQAADARKAAAENMPTRDWEASRIAHEQRMAAMDKKSEERFAQEMEYRASLLTLLENHLATMQRIESHLATLSAK